MAFVVEAEVRHPTATHWPSDRGRGELKPFSDWQDGRPETELNFQFYRQATNKITGNSEEAAAFLHGFF